MAKFQTYDAKINPYAGGAGSAITPMDIEQPVYQGALDVTKAVGGIGERLDKIQDYREQAAGININSDFRLKSLAVLRDAMSKKGADAIGLTDNVTSLLTKEATKILSQTNLRKARKDQLQQALNSDIFSVASSVSAHEAAENDVYNKQTIDRSFQAADAMLRTYALDDAKSNEIINGQLAVVQARSNDSNLLLKTKVSLIEARIDELNKVNPDKAKLFLGEHKNLIGASYDKILKDVEISRVKRDTAINPLETLNKLSSFDNTYVDVDMATKADMTQYVIGQINQRRSAEKAAQEQLNEKAKQEIIDLLVQGNELQANATLENMRKSRTIDSATYRDVLKFIKDEGVTSNPNETYQLEWDIITGRAGFNDIANAQDVSRKEKTRLATKLRSYQDTETQKSVLRQQSYQWVLNTAKNIIDPSGVMSTPETKKAALEFERSLFNATQGGKKEIDPYKFFEDNYWRYASGTVPKTKYGTPTNLQDIAAYKQRLANEAMRMTVQEVNDESEKIAHAEKIFKTNEEIKRNAGRRKGE
jgi:hypothetical protein